MLARCHLAGPHCSWQDGEYRGRINNVEASARLDFTFLNEWINTDGMRYDDHPRLREQSPTRGRPTAKFLLLGKAVNSSLSWSSTLSAGVVRRHRAELMCRAGTTCEAREASKEKPIDDCRRLPG